MCPLLEEIRKSGKKPKELNEYIAAYLNKNKVTSKEFSEAIRQGTDAERGTCIEALEYATQKNPSLAMDHLPTIFSCLSDKAPRVMWEASRVIGNIATNYPKEAGKAVELLLKNTNDKGTVVRWSAAFALGEILKSNMSLRLSLRKSIDGILKREENTGVKNVYLKAIKALEK